MICDDAASTRRFCPVRQMAVHRSLSSGSVKPKAGPVLTRFPCVVPVCGSYLPGYKSVAAKNTTQISAEIPSQQVFFFDRASRGTLNLANSAREHGALVVFEPSGLGEPRLFREAWSVSHVVKYANDRLQDITDLNLDPSLRNDVLLEIETLGSSGLRYRSSLNDSAAAGWNTLEVIAPPTLKDAAGAGDWCTAGVLHKLARGGLAGFQRVRCDRLVHALRYGQALATWGCAFESPRAGMYQVTRRQFDQQVQALLKGESFRLCADNGDHVPEDLRRLCPTCEGFPDHGTVIASKNESGWVD